MIRVDVKKRMMTEQGAMTLNATLDIPPESISTLFGPSGAGKTTTLRMIAGLTKPDAGIIEVDGDVWFDSRRGIDKPPQARRAGFLFQESTLFPHMTVRENLRYALKDKKDESRIDPLLEMVQMRALQHCRPATLSGGQKQRVALLRALLNGPQVFLLDEPFSALDTDLRLKLQDEFLALQDRLRVPVLFVTHDVSEVFKLSQRVFIMKDGSTAPPAAPAEAFGAVSANDGLDIVGTLLAVQQENGTAVALIRVGSTTVKTDLGADEANHWRAGSKVLLRMQVGAPVLLKSS